METPKEACVHCIDLNEVRLPVPGILLSLLSLGGILMAAWLAFAWQNNFISPVGHILGIISVVLLSASTAWQYWKRNLWGTTLYCSLDAENTLHMHRHENEAYLKTGGTSCQIWDKDPRNPGRLVLRGPGTIILELRFGWLRQCIIHGQQDEFLCVEHEGETRWEQAKIRGHSLILADRLNYTIALPILRLNHYTRRLELISAYLPHVLTMLRHYKIEDLLQLSTTSRREESVSVQFSRDPNLNLG